MKATIEGRRYDTDKAELIGEADSGGSVTDFAHWEAGLYRTPRAGRYFLAGYGGPMTLWARRVDGNARTGGSGIKPLSAHEALEWAEQHLEAGAVEAAFGGVIENA